MRVYLSGPIKDASDTEASSWRTDAEIELGRIGVSTINPMRRDYREDPCSHLPELVEQDKIDIGLSDILLVHFSKPSVGTSMEILYAWERGKRIITVTESWTNDAWMVYHSHHIYRTLDEAYAKIEKLKAEYNI